MGNNYHDYVIKNGQLIGDFEGMYQNCDDPWLQTNSTNSVDSISRNLTVLNVRKYKLRSVVEFGCGFGFLTSMINLNTNCRPLGVDISPTAIEKAKTRDPHTDFETGDLSNLSRFAEFEGFIFAQLTWYVLPQLKEVFANFQKYHKGKVFIHNLAFYKGEQQKYGRDYFTSFDEFCDFCPFQLLEYTYSTENNDGAGIDTNAVFRI